MKWKSNYGFLSSRPSSFDSYSYHDKIKYFYDNFTLDQLNDKYSSYPHSAYGMSTNEYSALRNEQDYVLSAIEMHENDIKKGRKDTPDMERIREIRRNHPYPRPGMKRIDEIRKFQQGQNARRIGRAKITQRGARKTGEKLPPGYGRCMKCKTPRRIQNARTTRTSRGQPALTGNCPVCGTTMYRFISRK